MSFVITVSFAAGSDCFAKTEFPARYFAALALAAVALSRHPFADVGRTVSELDAIPFGACQECHGIAVDQFDLCEVDSDDPAFLQRSAKDIQVFPRNPAADVKNDALFERKPVDSARHGCVAGCPMPHWQTERQPQLDKKWSKSQDPSRVRTGETGRSGDPVDLVDLVTGGVQRNLNCALSIFNALMRWSSVDGGTRSFAAAPDDPPTRPRQSASAASMISRSLRAAPCGGANASTLGRGRTDCFGNHDSSTANTSLELRITDRSITFCSSRMLPGQVQQPDHSGLLEQRQAEHRSGAVFPNVVIA